MVRIFAFQASDPGSNPGCRIFFFLRIIQRRNKGIKEIKNFIREVYIKVGEYNKKDE